VLDYDHVFCLTITGARSPIYENAQAAAPRILARSKAKRAAAGIAEAFGLYVLSSRNMFTGQGVLAAEAVRLIRAGGTPAAIGMRLHALAEQIHTYLVPADLFHIYKRASKKGDTSLSWGAYTLGQMLDMKPILRCHLDQTGPVAKVRGFEAGVERLFASAERQVRAGLKSPHICVSYGGEAETVESLPGFAALRQTAKQHGVSLLVSMMSKTAAINVGPGAVSLALGATGHEFE
jgi:fatty acid-binding protein DegV